jgi:hypothetical protein
MNTATTPAPLLLSERDAAAMLAVSPSQLAKMRYRGEVRAVLLGRKCIRYSVADLEALIARATTGGAGDAEGGGQ